jgi:hypothetical protein
MTRASRRMLATAGVKLTQLVPDKEKLTLSFRAE